MILTGAAILVSPRLDLHIRSIILRMANLFIQETRPLTSFCRRPGTDAAALASAAFSSCASLYAGRGFNGSFAGPASLQDSTYANTLLTHAEQLYTFAVNATGGKVTYQTSVPPAGQSYASSGFGDDLTLAALFLSLAEGSPARYQEASALYQQYKLGGQDSIFNWDSKTPGLAVLFAQMAQSSPDFSGDLASWQSEAERYFDRILQSGFRTPGIITTLHRECRN